MTAVEWTKIITEVDQTFCVLAPVNLNKSINGVCWVCGWINWKSEVLNIYPLTKGLSHASLINSARHECTRDVLSADCPTFSNTDSPLDLRGVNIEYVPKTNIYFQNLHYLIYFSYFNYLSHELTGTHPYPVVIPRMLYAEAWVHHSL